MRHCSSLQQSLSSSTLPARISSHERQQAPTYLTLTNHSNMPGITTFPPFPEDVPTHPLLIIDYELVKAGNEAEIDKFWNAATTLGFW